MTQFRAPNPSHVFEIGHCQNAIASEFWSDDERAESSVTEDVVEEIALVHLVRTLHEIVLGGARSGGDECPGLSFVGEVEWMQSMGLAQNGMAASSPCSRRR